MVLSGWYLRADRFLKGTILNTDPLPKGSRGAQKAQDIRIIPVMLPVPIRIYNVGTGYGFSRSLNLRVFKDFLRTAAGWSFQ